MFFPRDLAGNGGANPQRAVEPRKSLLELSAAGLAGVSDATGVVSWPGFGPAGLKWGEIPAFLGKERSSVGARQRGIKRGEQGWGESREGSTAHRVGRWDAVRGGLTIQKGNILALRGLLAVRDWAGAISATVEGTPSGLEGFQGRASA